jgi:class 3 adenylate cyclase
MATHPMERADFIERSPVEGRAGRLLYRRLLRIMIGYAAAAIVASLPLFILGLEYSVRQTLYILAIGATVTPLILGVDLITLIVLYRPIRGFFDDRDEGGIQHVPPEKALARALNFPVLTVLRIMCIHGPTALLSATLITVYVANPIFHTGYKTWQILALWCTIFVIAAAHALLEYFAVLRTIRPILPLIRSHGGLAPGQPPQGVIRVGLEGKLLFSSFFITLVPLSVLAFTTALKSRHMLAQIGAEGAFGRLWWIILWMFALGSLSTLITFSISVLMARDVGQLADRLVKAMRMVEKGDLGARLEIISTDDFADLYGGFNRMAASLEENKRLRDAFGRYLSPELVNQVIRDELRLGGESVNASILFSDIRGFTSLSERTTPEGVVSLLNRYFAAVEPVIQAQGGWINKFGGDSILAVFGAPVPQPDHPRRAVTAALAMREALCELNRHQESVGSPVLRIGIGVHCGWLVAGNVGSPNRMEYTVIGDAVNIASRLQTLTKSLDTDILISANVYQAAGSDFHVREMPPAEVQGKSMPLTIYAI